MEPESTDTDRPADPLISVVVPMFNEAECVDALHRRLRAVLASAGLRYEILCVDDGSTDQTAHRVERICRSDRSVRLLRFSRNFGHEAASTAGLRHARGDAVVLMDADLQDPPELIPRMIERWRSGCDVVTARRAKRHGENVFKRATSFLFYRIFRRLTGLNAPTDTGDFRLMDRKVVDAFSALGEHNRLVRALVSWTGFTHGEVEFDRAARFAGQTKYGLRKLVRLAGDSVISFSDVPIRAVGWVGAVCLVGGMLAVSVLAILGIAGAAVSAGAWLAAVGAVFCGVQLCGVGTVGAYVRRCLEEVRGRPLYLIREKIGFEDRGRPARSGFRRRPARDVRQMLQEVREAPGVAAEGTQHGRTTRTPPRRTPPVPVSSSVD